MFNTIQYGIDTSSGMIWSQYQSYVAVPVLQTGKMTSKNSFVPIFEFEVFDLCELEGSMVTIKWTRHVSNKIKNIHRKFWGLRSVDE
jgi:hypothetical protein